MGRVNQDREITSGDLAMARTFSGGREGTVKGQEGNKVRTNVQTMVKLG